MTDEKLIPFPKRIFGHPAVASQFASDTFQAIQPRMEKAMLAGDRIGLEVVIGIYERDIVPNNGWFYWHLAGALCRFGERLQDSEMIGRGIALFRRMLADELPGAPSTERHKAGHHGSIGEALTARGTLESSVEYLHDAVTSFEMALKSWRACLQFDCVQFSVGLGLTHLAIVEMEKDLSRLDAAGAAIGEAVEFNTSQDGVLWGHLRFAEAKLELQRARAGRTFSAAAGIKAADDAIALYGRWRPQYVILPTWIVRTEAVRDALAML